MTLKESYDYMVSKLSEYYSKTHNDDVGGMLGGFDTSFAGKPFDPAAWGDWEKAVRKVTPNANITEEEARKAMLVLMKEYNEHHGFDLTRVIEYFSQQNSSES